jgi:HDOD domain
VLFETKDRALASQALVAGLLHDLGKIVLAKNFEDLYGRVHSLARKQPVALWEIEKEMFGADHGEIGACLVGMWNMPLAIVDATALHHQPPLGEHTQLTPLAAVHVADVLEHERQPDNEKMMVAPIISTPFLNQIGLLQRLPLWRARFVSRKSGNAEAGVETAEKEQSVSATVATTQQTASQIPPPATPTRTGTLPQPQQQPLPDVHAAHYRTNKAYVAAAALLIALVLWFIVQPDPKPDRAYARTPAPQSEASANPSTEPWTQKQPQVKAAPTVAVVEVSKTPNEPSVPEKAVSEELVGPPAPPAPKASVPQSTAASASVTLSAPASPSTVPAPAPTVASAPATIPTNVPAPVVAPPPKPKFKLNGIIYTTRPSAIVNGIPLHVGEHLDGASVISITPTTVTLQINGQRKTFELR